MCDLFHYTGQNRGVVLSICNLNSSISKESPAVFRNWSKSDHHFVIKELEKEFNGENKLISLLIVQDVCQDCYQILLIILSK